MSASDRRILLVNWYKKAVTKALQGDAKRKYFEQAGALLTADGSDDHLIKLEGAPAPTHPRSVLCSECTA